MERVKGIEAFPQTSETIQSQSLPQVPPEDYTQIRAQILDHSSRDLAQIVAAWPKLSAPLKAAILAIVATNDKQNEALS